MSRDARVYSYVSSETKTKDANPRSLLTIESYEANLYVVDGGKEKYVDVGWLSFR